MNEEIFFSGNTYNNGDCSYVECVDYSWCPSNCNSIMWTCFENCEHKELFPLNYTDIFMFMLVTFTSCLSALSGVGGGALDTIIIMTVGDFPIEHAVPLSLCGIFGTAVIKFCYFVLRRNPLNIFQYLTNYKIVFFFVPLYGTCSYIGYVLNRESPFLLTMVVLVCVISFSIYKTIVKLFSVYFSSMKLNKIRTEIDGIYDIIVEKDNIETQNSKTVMNDYFPFNITLYELKLYCTIKNKQRFYVIILLNLVCLLINGYILIFTLLKKIMNFFVVFIFGLQCFITLVGIIAFAVYVYKTKKQNENQYGNLKWSFFNILKLCIASCITGVVSSYVGIGGGMILNPILVSMKVMPHVVIATYSVATFYSVSTTLMQYIIFGNFNFGYGVVMFFTGIIGSLCGVLLLNYFKNQKLILWCMLVSFVFSFIASLFSILSNIVQN